MPTAMVLAAGLGTRLRPLTDELPKPLMPIGDRPALAHILEALAAGGITQAVVNTHHLAHDFEKFEPPSSLAIQIVHEPEILGTAGGVRNAAALLGAEEVVVWNGDIHAPSLDVAALLEAHREREASATWVVARRERGEGTVGLDAQGHVVRLRGQRFGEEAKGGDFLGISVQDPALRASLPERGCLVGDSALPLLSRGAPIATYEFSGEWHDIGTPSALLEANLRWLRERGLRFHRAATARVAEGVGLDEAVVSEGAAAEGKGLLRRMLVLPGARVRAPMEGAVVGESTRAECERT